MFLPHFYAITVFVNIRPVEKKCSKESSLRKYAVLATKQATRSTNQRHDVRFVSLF
jgi:hypothetical protein